MVQKLKRFVVHLSWAAQSSCCIGRVSLTSLCGRSQVCTSLALIYLGQWSSGTSKSRLQDKGRGCSLNIALGVAKTPLAILIAPDFGIPDASKSKQIGTTGGTAPVKRTIGFFYPHPNNSPASPTRISGEGNRICDAALRASVGIGSYTGAYWREVGPTWFENDTTFTSTF